MNTEKSPIDTRHRSRCRQLFLSCILSAMIAIQLLAMAYSAGAETGQQKKQDSPGQEAEIIPVTYVTLRNKTGSPDPAEYFGGNRGIFYTGVCSVAFTRIRGLEEIAESAPFYIPDEIIELTAIRETAQDAFFDQLNQFSRQDNGNIVVYVHGYNIDFEKGCRQSAIFQRDLGLHNRLILFSWPADGNMLKYTWDESDLLWRVPYTADFLIKIIEQAGQGKIDVVAHSLGARGMVRALVRLASQKPGVPLINELILIAPDIDTDIFKQELPRFRQSVGRITLYLSDNDKALKLSREVHGYPRLGEAGEFLTVLPEVETIDISDISLRRASGHLYHLFNPEVIADLTRLLETGEPAAQRTSLQSVSRNGLRYWRLLPKKD